MRAARSAETALAAEHDELLHEIRVRRTSVVQGLGQGRWPVEEIIRLVDYLRYELLDQTVHEERLLYPLLPDRWSDPRIGQLVDEHDELREVTERLAALSADQPATPGAVSTADPARIVGLLDELEAVLHAHLHREEAALAEIGDRSVTALRRPFRAHDWFPLTEGPVIDVESIARLPTEELLDRIIHLHPGGRLELRSRAPLEIVEGLFQRRGLSSGYSWTYLEEGPERWRAELVRRHTDS